MRHRRRWVIVLAAVVATGCSTQVQQDIVERLQGPEIGVTREGDLLCLTIARGRSSGKSCTRQDALEPMLAASGDVMAYLDPTGRIDRAEIEFTDGRLDAQFGPEGVLAWTPGHQPEAARFFDADGQVLHVISD